MDQKPFSIVAGLIFTLVALFHLVRIYMGWPVDIGDWSVPMWFSWIGLVVAGGLAFFGFRLAAHEPRWYGQNGQQVDNRSPQFEKPTIRSWRKNKPRTCFMAR